MSGFGQVPAFGAQPAQTSFAFSTQTVAPTQTGGTFPFGQTQQPTAAVAPFSFGGTPTFGSTGTTGFGTTGTTGFGTTSFGTQPQQQQSTGGFNFQSQPQQQQPGQTSWFGTTTTQSTQPQQSSLFPLAQPQAATAFPFGSTATSTPQLGGISAFGSTAPTSSFFGATPTFGTTPAFGAASGTTSAFGAQQPTATAFGLSQPAAQTTNWFGSTATTQQQQQQPSAFSFNTQPAQSQPSLFSTQPAASSAFTFNTPNANTLGQSTFGQPAATSTSLFGTSTAGGFGTNFGTGTSFGAQPRPATTGFGFGTQPTQTTSLFGAPTTSLAQPAFSFNQPTSQPTTSSLFSFTQPTTTTTASAFTFATPATSASTLGGGLTFGQPATTAPSLFGTTPAFGTPNFGTGTTGFGTTGTGFGTTGTGFGTTGFGTQAKPPTFGLGQTTGFGQQQPNAFQLQLPQTSLFGQPQLQLQQQQQQQLLQMQQQAGAGAEESHAFYQSIFRCNKFGDERDNILATFNYLQACWGSGKGHYSQTLPPVTYTRSNPFYRFRSIGYSYIFSNSNEDGNVTLEIKSSSEKVMARESEMITWFQGLFGRQNITFKVEGAKDLEPELCLLNIYAEDKMTLRRILATELAAAFQNPQYKTQLDNMGVVTVSAKIKPSPEQLKRYKEMAPEGMDPRIWRQAHIDNPDPVNMIPVPILGVDGLLKRYERQEYECMQHLSRLSTIQDQVSSLNARHTNVTAEMRQIRAKQESLSHRLFGAVLKLEMMKRTGTPFQLDEELLIKKIQELNDKFKARNSAKSKLSELMPELSHQSPPADDGVATSGIADPTDSQLVDFVLSTHGTLKDLTDVVQTDSEHLSAIRESMTEINNKKIDLVQGR